MWKHAKIYLIIDNTLYLCGGYFILHHFLTHEEEEKVLNDHHGGAYGAHLSGLTIDQKILHVEYFWPSIFKEYIEEVKKFHPCQLYMKKMHVHPTLLHPVIAMGPFAKWGIDFMTCHPVSTTGHKYIIVVVDYFTKWVEAMPTFSNDSKMTSLFIFNLIIVRFGVPKHIVTDHGSHF